MPLKPQPCRAQLGGLGLVGIHEKGTTLSFIFMLYILFSIIILSVNFIFLLLCTIRKNSANNHDIQNALSVIMKNYIKFTSINSVENNIFHILYQISAKIRAICFGPIFEFKNLSDRHLILWSYRLSKP